MRLFQTERWAEFTREWFNSLPVAILGYDTILKIIGGSLFRTYNFLDIDTAQPEKLMNSINTLLSDEIYACRIISNYDFPATSGFTKKTEQTFQIDLTLPIETLWSNISKSCRKNISGWENEVITRFIGKDELPRYEKLLKETRKRLGLKMPPVYPNEVLWKHFGDDVLKVVIVETKDKQILGGLGFFCYDNEILEIGVAQAKKAIDEHIPTGELIKWFIIRWGKENSFKIYDLAGANPADKNIYFFKEKFGGQLINKYCYSKIYSPLLGFIRRSKNAIL